MNKCILLLCAVVLSGCATVHGPSADNAEVIAVKNEFIAKAFQYRLDQLKRLNEIGYRLAHAISKEDNLKAGTPTLGLFPVDRSKVSNMFFNQQPDKGVYLGFILDNTPAQKAGLLAGDLLLSINAVEVNSSKQVYENVKKLRAKEEVKVVYARNGQTKEVVVTVEDHPVNIRYTLSHEQAVNAISSWGETKVSYGLLNFVNSDDELAYVLAHEMAHSVRGHLKNIPIIYMGGALANGLYRDLERDADYYGLVFMKKAGYDLQAALSVHSRLATEIPFLLHSGFLYTHPSTAERIARVRKAIIELEHSAP